jgi:hypothetical protein
MRAEQRRANRGSSAPEKWQPAEIPRKESNIEIDPNKSKSDYNPCKSKSFRTPVRLGIQDACPRLQLRHAWFEYVARYFGAFNSLFHFE